MCSYESIVPARLTELAAQNLQRTQLIGESAQS